MPFDCSLLSSWQELVEVTVSSRFDLLASSGRLRAAVAGEADEMALAILPDGATGYDSAEDPTEVLYEVMKGSLLALERSLAWMDRMAPLLCSALQTMMSRLQVCRDTQLRVLWVQNCTLLVSATPLGLTNSMPD